MVCGVLFPIQGLVIPSEKLWHVFTNAFQLFDSLVSPVALYACEFWFPFVLPKKCFADKTSLLSAWEGLKYETANQQSKVYGYG